LESFAGTRRAYLAVDPLLRGAATARRAGAAGDASSDPEMPIWPPHLPGARPAAAPLGALALRAVYRTDLGVRANPHARSGR
jgi:hypothetical protein